MNSSLGLGVAARRDSGGSGFGGVGSGRTSPSSRHHHLRKVPSSVMLQAMATTASLNAVPEDEGNEKTVDENIISSTPTTTLSHSDSHTVLSLPPVPRELSQQGDDALRLKDGQDGSEFRVNLAPSEEAEVYRTSSMFSGAGTRSRSNSVNLMPPLPPSSASTSSSSSYASSSPLSSSTSASAASASASESSSSTARASRRIPRPDGGYSIINDPKLLARRQELIDSLDYFKRATQPRACPHCSSPVYAGEANMFDGVPYHKLCSQCDDCGLHLVPATGTIHNSKLFCRKCLQKDAGIAGYGYGNNGPFVAGGVNSGNVEADAGYYLRPRTRDRSSSLSAGAGNGGKVVNFG